MAVPFSKIYNKIWVGFCVLTLENTSFYFKANRKSTDSSKKM